MALKDDLLRIGYLPENLPPPFHTEEVAKYFSENASVYISDVKQPFRSAVTSWSCPGISIRKKVRKKKGPTGMGPLISSRNAGRP